MKFYPQERVGLFVDGQNLWSAAKALGFDVDYQKLTDTLGATMTLVRLAYFTPFQETEDFNYLRPLLDWLEFHEWVVVTRARKTDIDLAVTMMEMAESLDHFILASGCGDFCAVVEALQRRGKRVSILSTIQSPTPICATDLRRQADGFIDLVALRAEIARPARVKEPA